MKDIPVVDVSAIIGSFDKVSKEDYDKVAQDLGAAMGSIGFAYIVNHGIDRQKLDEIYKVSREFFELPGEIKRKYRKENPSKSFHGYAGPGDELLNEAEKNSTELRELWDVWGKDGQTKSMYPQEISGFYTAFDNVQKDLGNCAKKLLRCLAKYLKLDDEDFFVKRHKNLDDLSVKTQTQMRSLYYYNLNPNDNIPPDAIRCGEHSDWGSITLLFQDMVGGLEVRSSCGKWIPATPIKDAILINSGQLMELWTAGQLRAAQHRVRILTEGRPATEPRQSFIYFVNPDGYEKVFPVVPIAPGKEEFAERETLVAYDHYQRLIDDAVTY